MDTDNSEGLLIHLISKELLSFLLDLFILLSRFISQPQFTLPSSLLLVLSLPPVFPYPIHSSPVPLQKCADLLGISTQHGISSSNETKQIPSCQDWTRLLSSGKGVPHTGKRFRDTPSPSARSPTETPSYATKTYI